MITNLVSSLNKELEWSITSSGQSRVANLTKEVGKAMIEPIIAGDATLTVYLKSNPTVADTVNIIVPETRIQIENSDIQTDPSNANSKYIVLRYDPSLTPANQLSKILTATVVQSSTEGRYQEVEWVVSDEEQGIAGRVLTEFDIGNNSHTNTIKPKESGTVTIIARLKYDNTVEDRVRVIVPGTGIEIKSNPEDEIKGTGENRYIVLPYNPTPGGTQTPKTLAPVISYQGNANGENNASTEFEWVLNDEIRRIISIDETNQITPVASGTVSLTAKVKYNDTVTDTIRVIVPGTGIRLRDITRSKDITDGEKIDAILKDDDVEIGVNIIPEGNTVNQEIIVTCTSNDIVKINGRDYTEPVEITLDASSPKITVTGKNTGTVDITIALKHNPEVSQMFKVEVVNGVESLLIAPETLTALQSITYYKGDAINLAGGRLIGTYTNGDPIDIPMTNASVHLDEYHARTIGKQTVTVWYGNKSVSFEITVQKRGFSIPFLFN